MKLLTNRTLEIPPFLLRNPDGSFTHRDIAVSFTAAVITPVETDAFAEAIEASRRRDKHVADQLRRAETLTSKERQADQAAARKEQKAAEANRLLKNKLKQREVFVQHFKWDHEQ